MWDIKHILSGTDHPAGAEGCYGSREHLAEGQRMRTVDLLQQIAREYGFNTVDGMLAAAVFDSVAPGVCLNCHETQDCEPDATNNWCENCGRNMVASVLTLANLI